MYLVAIKKLETPETVNISGETMHGTNYYYELFFSNGDMFEINEIFGECGSGYTTATYASIDSGRMYDLNYPEDDYNETHKLKHPIKYLGLETSETKDDLKDHTLLFEDNQTIIIDELGIDAYYPTGNIIFNLNYDIDSQESE